MKVVRLLNAIDGRCHWRQVRVPLAAAAQQCKQTGCCMRPFSVQHLQAWNSSRRAPGGDPDERPTANPNAGLSGRAEHGLMS